MSKFVTYTPAGIVLAFGPVTFPISIEVAQRLLQAEEFIEHAVPYGSVSALHLLDASDDFQVFSYEPGNASYHVIYKGIMFNAPQAAVREAFAALRQVVPH